MVVRCKSCNSAFAVDDDKVDNKKFAFKCPKCETENVIDNRVAEDAAVSQQPMEMKGDADLPGAAIGSGAVTSEPESPMTAETEESVIDFADEPVKDDEILLDKAPEPVLDEGAGEDFVIDGIDEDIDKGTDEIPAEDDFGVPKNAFIVCSFWLINALYLIGEKRKAKHLFDCILEKQNHLGLLSEDVETKTGRLTGNFPQGYSHLALIQTILLLQTEYDWTDL